MDEPPSFELTQYFSGDNLLYILITVLLLFVSAVISISEAGFFSLEPAEIESFRRLRSKKGKTIAELLNRPRLLLGVLTFWKYLMLISCAIIFTIGVQVSDTSSLGTELFLLVISFAIVGIIIPKVYGTTARLTIVPLMSGGCKFLVAFTTPFIAPLLKMSTKVEKKLEQLNNQGPVTELTQALELAAADKGTTEDEKQILKGIVNFGTLTVDEVMRPAKEIDSVDVALNFHDLLIYIKKSGFSRLPAYNESFEKIEGVLYIKDLLPYLREHKKFNWQKLLRPAYFVNENKKIDSLLKEFQEKRVHMALALDQQGKVSGLITLEDIIEEIIGEIHDEFDEAGAFYKKIDERTFVFDSKISLNEFCRILDVDPVIFETEGAENETLGGALADLQQELPKKGDQISLDPLTLVIEAVDHKRVKKIRVFLNEQKES